MKMFLQAAGIIIVSLVIGIFYNTAIKKEINPFKGFGGDANISLDLRTIKDFGEIIKYFENKSAVFIDVRSKKDYEDGHIPGSLSAPYFYMERAYGAIALKLKISDTLILYGENNTDMAPVRTADYYTSLNFKTIKIMLGGVERWKKEGLPLDTGSEK
jgi:3-mercaptopyruvate sulfurtransferase SseA